MPNKYLTKWYFMCFNKNRKDENEMTETNEKIFELLNDQFEEMLADEDAWGYDFAEVYNVLQSKDIERAKQILTELNVEY